MNRIILDVTLKKLFGISNAFLRDPFLLSRLNQNNLGRFFHILGLVVQFIY